MIAVGVITFLSSEQDKPHHLGRVAIGLGLMLLSLRLLSLATDPLRTSPAFIATLGKPAGRVRDRRHPGHAGHLVRPFEPVDRVAGDVVCRRAASSARRSRWPWSSAPISAARWRPTWRSRASDVGRATGAARQPDHPRSSPAWRCWPFLGPVVHWLSLIDPSPARLTVNFHTAFSVIAARRLPAADRAARQPVPPPAARQACGRRPRQAAPSRPRRARLAGRGPGLRAARDAEPGRPRGRHAARHHRRLRRATIPRP